MIAANVECPSLSPDDKEIAFKRRLAGPGVRWRLSVLDLATMKVHPLAETRSVDDQVEWLNGSTVLYGVLQDKAIAAENPLSLDTRRWPAGPSSAPTPSACPPTAAASPRCSARTRGRRS